VTEHSDIDGVINAWVNATASTLFVDERGSKTFHIPGAPPHECFQIVVFPPSEDQIVVQAAAIDTNNDTEMEMLRTWNGSTRELDAMLSEAMATVEAWKTRPGPACG
jgi:hypothetical protein